MGHLFIRMLGLSLAGAATCLLAAAAGVLVKNRLKSSWLYYLWLIVLLAFIVPVPLNLPFASSGLREAAAAITSAIAPIEHPPAFNAVDTPAPDAVPEPPSGLDDASAPGNSAGNPAAVPAGVTDITETDNTGTVITLTAAFFRFLPYVWLAGAITALLWTILSYAASVSTLRAGRVLLIPGHVPVYESARVTTPILAGLLRPAVYLPAGFPRPGLAIGHELMHLRRGDLWLKWVAQLTLCAHWFNPLAYMMRRELNRLSELACDEAVVRRLDPLARSSYGSMLLDAATRMSGQKGMMFVGLGKDKRLLKERIKNVMKTRKTTKKTMAVMALLTTVVLFSALVFGAVFSGCANQPAASGADDITAADSSSDVSMVITFNAPAVSPSPNVIRITALVTTRIVDLPFDRGADVKGTWLPVGKFDSVSSFVPPSSRAASTWELAIAKDGLGWYAFYTQREGFHEVTGYPRWASAVSYEIKELDGKTYLFIEEKSGGDLISYFVFEKLSDTVPAHNGTPPGSGDSVLVITDMS